MTTQETQGCAEQCAARCSAAAAVLYTGPYLSREQVERLTLLMVQRGMLSGYTRTHACDVRHGDEWAVEQVLRDAGIAFEDHNDSLSRKRVAESLDGAAL